VIDFEGNLLQSRHGASPLTAYPIWRLAAAPWMPAFAGMTAPSAAHVTPAKAGVQW